MKRTLVRLFAALLLSVASPVSASHRCDHLRAGDTVIFIGDSNTWGGLVEEHETFVHRVGESLSVETINAGVFGSDSGDWVPWGALWRDLVSPGDYDAAVVMLGSNDAALGIPLSTYIGNMVIVLSSLATHITLITAPPRPLYGWTIALYEAWMGELATNTLEPVCDLIRSSQILDPRQDFYDDGIHLNANGHAAIAEAIVKAMKR